MSGIQGIYFFEPSLSGGAAGEGIGQEAEGRIVSLPFPEEWMPPSEVMRLCHGRAPEGSERAHYLSAGGRERVAALLYKHHAFLPKSGSPLREEKTIPYFVTLHFLLMEIVGVCQKAGVRAPQIFLKGGALLDSLTEEDYRGVVPQGASLDEGVLYPGYADVDLMILIPGLEPEKLARVSEEIQLFFQRGWPGVDSRFFLQHFFEKRFLCQDTRNNWSLATIQTAEGRSLDLMVSSGLVGRDHICTQDGFVMELPVGSVAHRKTDYLLSPCAGLGMPLTRCLADRAHRVIRSRDPLRLDPNAFLKICSLRSRGNSWSAELVRGLLEMIRQHPRVEGDGKRFAEFIEEGLVKHPPRGTHGQFGYIWAVLEVFSHDVGHPFLRASWECCQSIVQRPCDLEETPFLKRLRQCLIESTPEDLLALKHATVLGSLFLFLFTTVGKGVSSEGLRCLIKTEGRRHFFEVTHPSGGVFYSEANVAEAIHGVLSVANPHKRALLMQLIQAMAAEVCPLDSFHQRVEHDLFGPLGTSLGALMSKIRAPSEVMGSEQGILLLYLIHLCPQYIQEVIDVIPYMVASFPSLLSSPLGASLQALVKARAPGWSEAVHALFAMRIEGEGSWVERVLETWLVVLSQNGECAHAQRAWEFYKQRGGGELSREKMVGLILARKLAERKAIASAWIVFNKETREGEAESYAVDYVMTYLYLREKFFKSGGEWRTPIGVALLQRGKELFASELNEECRRTFVRQQWHEVGAAVEAGREEEAKKLLCEMPGRCFAPAELSDKSSAVVQLALKELQRRGKGVDLRGIEATLRRNALTLANTDPCAAWDVYKPVASLKSAQDFAVWERLLLGPHPSEECQLHFLALLEQEGERNRELETFFAQRSAREISTLLKVPDERHIVAYLKGLIVRNSLLAHVLIQQEGVVPSPKLRVELFSVLAREYMGRKEYHAALEALLCAQEDAAGSEEVSALIGAWLEEASRAPGLFKQNLEMLLRKEEFVTPANLLRFATCCYEKKQFQQLRKVLQRICLPIDPLLQTPLCELVMRVVMTKSISIDHRIEIIRKFSDVIVQAASLSSIEEIVKCLLDKEPSSQVQTEFNKLMHGWGAARGDHGALAVSYLCFFLKVQEVDLPQAELKEFREGVGRVIVALSKGKKGALAINVLLKAQDADALPRRRFSLWEALFESTPQKHLDRCFSKFKGDLGCDVDAAFVEKARTYLEMTQSPHCFRLIIKHSPPLELGRPLLKLALEKQWKDEAVKLLLSYSGAHEELKEERMRLAALFLREKHPNFSLIWELVGPHFNQVQLEEIPFWSGFFKMCLDKGGVGLLERVLTDEFPRLDPPRREALFCSLAEAAKESSKVTGESIFKMRDVWRQLVEEEKSVVALKYGVELMNLAAIHFSKEGNPEDFKTVYSIFTVYEGLMLHHGKEAIFPCLLQGAQCLFEMLYNFEKLPVLNRIEHEFLEKLFNFLQDAILLGQDDLNVVGEKVTRQIALDGRLSVGVRKRALRSWLYFAREEMTEGVFPRFQINEALDVEYAALRGNTTQLMINNRMHLMLRWAGYYLNRDDNGGSFFEILIEMFREIACLASVFSLHDIEKGDTSERRGGGELVSGLIHYFQTGCTTRQIMLDDWIGLMTRSLEANKDNPLYVIIAVSSFFDVLDIWINPQAIYYLKEEDLPQFSSEKEMTLEERKGLGQWLVRVCWNERALQFFEEITEILIERMSALGKKYRSQFGFPQASISYDTIWGGLLQCRVISRFHLGALRELIELGRSEVPTRSLKEFEELARQICRNRDKMMREFKAKAVELELGNGGAAGDPMPALRVPDQENNPPVEGGGAAGDPMPALRAAAQEDNPSVGRGGGGGRSRRRRKGKAKRG